MFWNKGENEEFFKILIDNVLTHLEPIVVNISKEKKHILDYYLEYLCIIMNRNKYQTYFERIQQMPITNLESSSKFLLKNLLEI
jgi:hypothetical protein